MRFAHWRPTDGRASRYDRVDVLSMAVEVTMPQMGESVVEGTIVKWLVHEGENVGEDQPLVEISTDKVDTEIPSPAAGVISKIIAVEGQTLPVGAQLAVIESSAPSRPPRPAAPLPSAGTQASGTKAPGKIESPAPTPL